MIRMFEDNNYSSNRNTTYGDQKMVEEFNKPYPRKNMLDEDKIQKELDNHERLYEGFVAEEILAGNVVKEARNRGVLIGLKIAENIIAENKWS